MPILMTPIAHIETDFTEKFGIPRQSGRVPQLRGKVIFEPPFRDRTALRGIETFSHLWLIFEFSLVRQGEWSPAVRPPRLGGNTRMGVFATRSPYRPNPIGISCVRLLGIEEHQEGAVLLIGGADLVSGTPILDIKPYLPYADCVPEATSGFASKHTEQRLSVVFPDDLLARIPPDKREVLIGCLAEDPRPAYQHDASRNYAMIFAGQNIHFRVSRGQLRVTVVDDVKGEALCR